MNESENIRICQFHGRICEAILDVMKDEFGRDGFNDDQLPEAIHAVAVVLSWFASFLSDETKVDRMLEVVAETVRSRISVFRADREMSAMATVIGNDTQN